LGAKQPVPQACRRRPVERGCSSSSERRADATAPVATHPEVAHSTELAAHVKVLDGIGGLGLGGRGGLGNGGLGLGGGGEGGLLQSAPLQPSVQLHT